MKNAICFLLMLWTSAAFGAAPVPPNCVPTSATIGMIGCTTIAGSISPTTDYVQIWSPGVFPDSARLITPAHMLTGQTITGGILTGTFSGSPTFSGAVTFSGSTLFSGSAPSGAGITSLFASPPAIGGTTPAAGAFTSIVAGTPSGGASGAGTINAVAYYVNGVAIGVGPFLPLTGGTVTGATTFSAGGTGVAITNSATVGGNLSVTGTLNAGAFNNTSVLGYQSNGLTTLFITPLDPTGGVQQGVFVGVDAGQYFQTNNLPTRFGMWAGGIDALKFYQDAGGEAVCTGQYSCWFVQHGYGITAHGQSTIAYDTAPQRTSAFGNDSMRDTQGATNSSAFGNESQDDGSGSSNSSFGTFSLHGNAGSIIFPASFTTGDVFHFTFTTTSGSTTGLPATVSYTIPAGATTLSVMTGVLTQMSILTVGYLQPNGVNALTEWGLPNILSAFTSAASGVTANVIALHVPGSFQVSASITCTGTCSSIPVYSAPFTGVSNIAIGPKALYSMALTAANYNIAEGDEAWANLSGTSSGNIGRGYQVAHGATAGTNNIVDGFETMSNPVSLQQNVILAPFLVGVANSTIFGAVILGAASSNSVCFPTSNGVVSIGFADCPPAGNWAMSIQDGALAGTNNNHGGGGGGGGQIGVEIANSNVMTATFTVSDFGGAATYGSHVRFHQTTLPAPSACGGGTPALDANASDTGGTVTEGTSATGCVVTFHVAYPTTPHCQITALVGNATVVGLSAVSTTALTVTNSAGSGNVFNYACWQ